jgi:glycosyltransferase involved in cell wall biosynthesis
MPQISVIIPFHNRIEWTKDAIKSVLAQTFQDFEIIVVDDGSSNNYAEEIKDIDKRILYIRQEPKGPSSARNAGLRAASGEFVAFLDSDDIFLPPKLEVQYKIMKENSQVLLSHTSYTLMDEDKRLGITVSTGFFTGQVYPRILGLCPIATPTVMLRRDAIQGIYFNEDVDVAEDILFWTEISRRSEIVSIEEPLTLVRLHGKNSAYDPDKQLLGIKNLINLGVLPHTDISWRTRNHILCELYAYAGIVHFKKKEYFRGVIATVKAFFLSPAFFLEKTLNSPVYYFYKIVRIIIPASVRSWLGEMRKSKKK